MRDPFFKQRGPISVQVDRPLLGIGPSWWTAIRPDSYDGTPDSHPTNRLLGSGVTEEEAVRDLIEQESEYFEPDPVEPDESAAIN